MDALLNHTLGRTCVHIPTNHYGDLACASTTLDWLRREIQEEIDPSISATVDTSTRRRSAATSGRKLSRMGTKDLAPRQVVPNFFRELQEQKGKKAVSRAGIGLQVMEPDPLRAVPQRTKIRLSLRTNTVRQYQ